MRVNWIKQGVLLGYIFFILCLWVTIATSSISKEVFSIQEYCSFNTFVQYIEPGDIYELTLNSEATSDKNKWYQKSKRKCLKEFKSSDAAAHFIVDITNMNIPSRCSDCICNYFEISASASHKKRFCRNSESESFSSKSNAVSIEFRHSFKMPFNVTLTFTVERNVYVINGSPLDHGQGASSYLETPYFPSLCPPSYRAEYVLETDPNSHVVLLFLDFHISDQSFIEVNGNNGTHPTMFFGNIFRPPVIVSQFNRLDIKFQSNSQRDMPGFRALTSFVKTIDSLSVPHTDCGGLIDGRVGYMKIKTLDDFSLYDCVWQFTHMCMTCTQSSLSVSVQLKDVGYKSSLEFRSGFNSKAEIVKNINCENEDCSNLDVEMTVQATKYLYIRFNGYLDVYSVVNMSYSTYHTGNCSDSEFLCENGRCLHMSFRCDGINQCPSGSDEENCVGATVLEAQIPQIPSVQRESIDNNAVYKKFFIILLVGSFGLVAVLIAVFVFMCKFKKAAAVTNVEQAIPQRPREMSDVSYTFYQSNPRIYDSPPSYEDFIKASDCYPPLLYTRVKHPYIPKDPCMYCTTSFCTGSRHRHHSDNSSLRSSNAGSDLFAGTRSEGSGQIGINLHNASPSSSATPNKAIKRWFSLDSKLNDLVKQDTCHLFFSVIHPVCSHTSNHLAHIQCHTLPKNFKIMDTKTDNNDAIRLQESMWLSPCSSHLGPIDRRCTWSIVPQSASGSEVVTILKSRCCSDPCKSIQVHCSLH